MLEDESPPYYVGQQDGRGRVLTVGGEVVCVCGDLANAEHYAALLNQAYRRGYKLGYRAGKSSGADRGR